MTWISEDLLLTHQHFNKETTKQLSNPSIIGYDDSTYAYDNFYLSDKYGNKLTIQKEIQMNIEELGGWEETWKEQLYARDYDSLPSFMEDALLEYFEDGGTAELFNKAYAYNEETADLVIDLYNENNMSTLTDKQIRDKAYLLVTGNHLTESFNYEDFQSVDISEHLWELVEDWPIEELESHITQLADQITQLCINIKDSK